MRVGLGVVWLIVVAGSSQALWSADEVSPSSPSAETTSEDLTHLQMDADTFAAYVLANQSADPSAFAAVLIPNDHGSPLAQVDARAGLVSLGQRLDHRRLLAQSVNPQQYPEMGDLSLVIWYGNGAPRAVYQGGLLPLVHAFDRVHEASQRTNDPVREASVRTIASWSDLDQVTYRRLLHAGIVLMPHHFEPARDAHQEP